MTEQAKIDDKVQKPAAHFDQPNEVVVDSSLSKSQKIKALDTLEQDARQLSEASAEGMTGGERSKLHEVLKAKGGLTLHLKHTQGLGELHSICADRSRAVALIPELSKHRHQHFVLSP